MKKLFLLISLCMISLQVNSQSEQPLRLGIIGLTHSHVGSVLNNTDKSFQIVGIVEKDTQLVERMAKRFGFNTNLVYPTMEEMYDAQKPEAVSCFNPTACHLEVVRFFAPKGVHIMVEKPLAATYQQAQEMATLARQNKIHLLTNYETSWYGSVHEAYDLLQNNVVGDIRKTVFRDGHTGPVERNTHPEMITWIRDPELNGGGVAMDFGCYGANIMTWLMNGEKPQSVTAVFQQIKPDQYPEVEDQATIILTYPKAQCIIEASWNFPINIKTMEIYGQTGYISAPGKETLLIKAGEKEPLQQSLIMDREVPYNNAFRYLSSVVRENSLIDPLSSLENNLIVMEILDAAKQSAAENKTIYLK